MTETETATHDYKVGDILYSSWGYDQTNINFYQVVRTTAKSIWLRAIRAAVTETGMMCGESVARPNDFTDFHMKGEKRCLVKDKDGWVKLSSFEYAHRWDGKPKYTSWYA